MAADNTQQVPGQPKPPPMPGMVNTMAQGMAQPQQSSGGFNGFTPKSAEDIYRMSDADRTQYWQGLHEAAGGTGNYKYNGMSRLGGSDEQFNYLQNYYKSLSPDLQQDFMGGYLTPQHRAEVLQQMQAEAFRKGMPGMQEQMGNDLKKSANSQMSAGLKQINQSNQARGLLNSGINLGQQLGLKAKTQAAVASGMGGINNDLEQAAQGMEQDAMSTGISIQQAQQQMYNQAYQRAMARMNADNQTAGSAMGLVATAAMIAAL